MQRCWMIYLLVAALCACVIADHNVCADFGKCCDTCSGKGQDCTGCCKNTDKKEFKDIQMKGGHCNTDLFLKGTCWCES